MLDTKKIGNVHTWKMTQRLKEGKKESNKRCTHYSQEICLCVTGEHVLLSCVLLFMADIMKFILRV